MYMHPHMPLRTAKTSHRLQNLLHLTCFASVLVSIPSRLGYHFSGAPGLDTQQYAGTEA